MATRGFKAIKALKQTCLIDRVPVTEQLRLRHLLCLYLNLSVNKLTQKSGVIYKSMPKSKSRNLVIVHIKFKYSDLKCIHVCHLKTVNTKESIQNLMLRIALEGDHEPMLSKGLNDNCENGHRVWFLTT